MKRSYLWAGIITILVLVGGIWWQQHVTGTDQQAFEEQSAQVTVDIDGQQYAVVVPDGSTALDVMNQAQRDDDLTYSGKEYEGLGYLVETINGQTNNTSDNVYWTLYMNNEVANVGVNDLIVHTGDAIGWKYETLSF